MTIAAQEILNMISKSTETMTKQQEIYVMNDIIGELETMVESLEMEIEQENEL